MKSTTTFALVSCLLLAVHANATEIICRYCAEGRSHQMLPLGLDLKGRYQYAPDRQVDVQHIKLDVTPDFKKRTVAGTTSITAAPISKAVEILRLDAIDINVKAVHCDGAKVADYVSTRRELRIAFDQPVPVGRKITVHIDYSVQPNAGLYFRTPEMGYPKSDTHIWTQGEAHEARHWFPCFDYPNERSSTEVICHVPKDMTVLSNGKRMGEEVDDRGLKAVRWLQEKPHVNYLICLVAGHLEKLEKKHGDVPLGFYTQPTLIQHAKNSFRDTPDIMAFFEKEIGMSFPWVKYDQVTIRDFTSGGMENTTLTTLTSGTIFSEATENIRSSRGLDAHEMAHQWFGDYVTCKDWSHLWLNEGFATYYTHLYEGHKFGRDAMLYGLYRDAGRILSQKNDVKPIVYNAYTNPMQQFDYRAYPKGSWVLHMLRSQLGEDLYRRCVKAYLKKHALTSVVSDDLRQVIEDHSGQTMDRFFDQWLYHARHPDLKISYSWMTKEKLAKVNIKQTHKVNDDVLLFRFPTKLRFVVDGQVVDQEIEVSLDSEDFYVPLESQPTLVRFDPDYSVLAEISFDKSNELTKAQIENQNDMIGRLLACRLLEGRKTHDSVKLLENALQNDSFFGVRIAAARALAKHETDEAFAVLEKSWKLQQDARVRLEVVSKLVNRFKPETPALIAQILEKEANPAIQASAIRGLGRFHGDETRQQLIKYLDSKSFRNEIAVAAISAISQQSDPSYTDPLMDVLSRREEDFTSNGFAQGLTTLAQVAKSLDEKEAVREFFVARINHPKSRVQSASMRALGTLGDARAISVLQAFSDSSDERVSRTAKQAIDSLRDSKPTAPSELIELRKTVAEMKKQDEKLKAELKELREQLKAQK